MSQTNNIIRLGELVGPPRRESVVAHREMGAASDASSALRDGSDLTNVIPFTRLRHDNDSGDAATKLVLGDDDRPAPAPARRDTKLAISALALASALIHGGLLAALNREPPPMASIGIEAISVELVLGANSNAGPATTASEAQSPPTTSPAPAEPEQPAAAPQEAALAPAEVPPDTVPPPPQEDPPPPQPPAPAEVAVEPQPEPPVPHQEAALPQPAAEPEPAPPPEKNIEAAPPTPAPKPADPVAVVPPPRPDVPKEPEPRRPEKPRKPVAEPPAPARKPAHRDTANRARPAAADARPDNRRVAAVAPGGAGPGSSASESNYRGTAAAHLARFKQFPADARSRGEQGTSVVSFSLDGSGRVTRVTLVRGTGIASLDRESEAMVRRASPFPPPPGGRPMTISAPVNFRLR